MPFLYPEVEAWLRQVVEAKPGAQVGWVRHDDLWFVIVGVA